MVSLQSLILDVEVLEPPRRGWICTWINEDAINDVIMQPKSAPQLPQTYLGQEVSQLVRVQLHDFSELLSCCFTGYRRRPRVQQDKQSIQSDRETEPCV